MTGTSIDGIDAALVRIDGSGLEIRAQFIKGVSAPLGELTGQLRAFANNSACTAAGIAQMSLDLGRVHRDVLKELLAGTSPDLIVLHGQTVFHRPPLSWQMINPWPVAQEFGKQVIFDLRGADLAAGGEGAPITPTADFILFRDPDRARVIVNLGGFINYTYIPAGRDYDDLHPYYMTYWLAGVRGSDVSPCNQLLDNIARQLLGKPFDEGGAAASHGECNEGALNNLLERLTPTESKLRSLGTGDEAFDWCRLYQENLASSDLLRTACVGIAQTLRLSLMNYRDYDLIVAGGGIYNRTLMEEIADRLEREPQTTDDFGVPAQYREAVEIAILGDLASQGVNITLPQITGRQSCAPDGCRIGNFR